MKTIFIVLTYLIAINTNNSQKHNKSNEHELDLKAVVKGVYNLPEKDLNGNDSLYYYLVEIRLTNNSKSIVEFITFSCASGANIVISTANNTLIKTCSNNCGQNSMKLINLKPKQGFLLPVILAARKEVLGSKIQLGWVLLNDYDDFKNYINKDEGKKDQENIVWSNTIKLVISGGQPYEIK